MDLVPPQDNLHKLSIINAILWVRITVNRTLWKQFNRTVPGGRLSKPVKLYIFRVVKTPSHTVDGIPPVHLHHQRNLFNDRLGGNSTGTRSSFELLTTYRLPNPVHQGWIKIDLTRAVREWFSVAVNSNNRLSLLIDCVGCNNIFDVDLIGPSQNFKAQQSSDDNLRPSKVKQNMRPSNGHAIPSDNQKRIDRIKNTIGQMRRKKRSRHFQPFVVITTKTRLRKRSRRHAYNCEDGIRQCCKQSLYVDFHELGWNDWIIFPKGYTANYCMGECVQLRTPDVLAYFHSHVLEEYRIKNPYASITPCCAPTKLSSISLIYFDQGGHIIKADLPKMVVDECGCT